MNIKATNVRTSKKLANEINWDNLRYFLALAENKTFSAAARQLCVTHVTMARRIEQLEADFGAALFDQTPNGFRLTAAGDRILAHSKLMGEQVIAISDVLTEPGPSGVVRLSATPYLSDELAGKCLPTLLREHPEIAVNLIAENRNLDILRLEAHLSVRLVRPQEGGFVIRRLGTMA